MKTCTKCGDESEDFTAGKTHCRPCRADKAAQSEILMAALKEMAEEFRGIVKPTDARWTLAHCTDPNLLTVIPMGDPHIGMHSWHEETGEDFDLKIAQANMESAFAELMAARSITLDFSTYDAVAAKQTIKKADKLIAFVQEMKKEMLNVLS